MSCVERNIIKKIKFQHHNLPFFTEQTWLDHERLRFIFISTVPWPGTMSGTVYKYPQLQIHVQCKHVLIRCRDVRKYNTAFQELFITTITVVLITNHRQVGPATRKVICCLFIQNERPLQDRTERIWSHSEVWQCPHFTYKRIKGVSKIQFFSILSTPAPSFFVGAVHFRALGFSSTRPIGRSPDTEYNTRCSQLQIIRHDIVLLLFPAGGNPDYDVAHQFSLVIYCHWVFNDHRYILRLSGRRRSRWDTIRNSVWCMHCSWQRSHGVHSNVCNKIADSTLDRRCSVWIH